MHNSELQQPESKHTHKSLKTMDDSLVKHTQKHIYAQIRFIYHFTMP